MAASPLPSCPKLAQQNQRYIDLGSHKWGGQKKWPTEPSGAVVKHSSSGGVPISPEEPAGCMQLGDQALIQRLQVVIRDACRYKRKIHFCLSKVKGVLVTNWCFSSSFSPRYQGVCRG